jgi:formylglycine-generating enzyme required for sulfatase activity
MTEHFTYAFLTELPTHALQDRLRAAVPVWQWTLDRATDQLRASDSRGAVLAISSGGAPRRTLSVDFHSEGAGATADFYAILESVFRQLLPALEPRSGAPVVAAGQRDMVLVPGGRFVMGLSDEEADRLAHELAVMEVTLLEEREDSHRSVEEIAASRRDALRATMPAHEVEVGEFYIDRYPVTVDEYARYMKQTGAVAPATWKSGQPDGRTFVAGISWREATAFADFHDATLPTEAEWERAARDHRSAFPWGDAYFPLGRLATPEDSARTAWVVGSRPQLASVHGVQDLIGTFGEFTADPFRPYPGADETEQDSTTVYRNGIEEDQRAWWLKVRLVRRAIR